MSPLENVFLCTTKRPNIFYYTFIQYNTANYQPCKYFQTLCYGMKISIRRGQFLGLN